jgi:hypothetical protein
MKKLVLTFISIVFASVLLAQTDTATVETKTDISFNKTVHDYGTIEKGSDGTCEFEFSNTGKIPLTLINVQSSCGCTVPSWSKEPIMPGSQGKITVKYNTQSIGPISKTVHVFSNARTNPSVLSIRGVVVQKPAK